jgi:type IV pilus assembly protein PilV
MNQLPMHMPTTCARRTERGFTLIEVLVALVILSIGLLGLGLLQASSLKASFGSNHRTMATNLAYEMLDMMRANRPQAYRYNDITTAVVTGVNSATCSTQPANSGDVVADDEAVWECEVMKDLPGVTTAYVTLGGGIAKVEIAWSDQRFNATATNGNSDFVLATQL